MRRMANVSSSRDINILMITKPSFYTVWQGEDGKTVLDLFRFLFVIAALQVRWPSGTITLVVLGPGYQDNRKHSVMS